MQPERMTRFTDSLARCLARPAFLTRFYRRFVASSDEIGDKFRDTDMDKQKAALSASLYLTTLALEGGEAAMAYMETVARRHAHDRLDVRPELYDTWLECLVATVEEHDPEFSAEVEGAWREAMQFSIDYMRRRY